MFILRLLEEGPKHGYSLIKRIEELAGKTPSPGTIYPLLKELLDEGLVVVTHESRGGKTLRVYELTDAGRRALEERVEDVEAVMRLARGYRVFRELGGDEFARAVRTLIEKLADGDREFAKKAGAALRACTSSIRRLVEA